MALVDISRLPKAEVIWALFNNARYSPYSIRIKALFPRERQIKIEGCIQFQFGNIQISKNKEKFLKEINEILKESCQIGWINCVRLNIDFSGEIIDAQEYDQMHKVIDVKYALDGMYFNDQETVLPAGKCIENLRYELAKKEVPTAYPVVTFKCY